METTNNIKTLVDYCKHKGWSHFTKINYSSALKKFLVAHPGIYQHDHISDSMVSEYLLKIPGRSARCTAHSAIKLWFMLKGQPNKLKFIPYPEKEEKLPIHVNQQEFLKMISVCQNEKHRVILALLFDCGLRVSEVVNLKIKDIDTSNMVLNILQAKGRKDRKVKLSKVMLALLNSYYISHKPTEYLLEGQFGGKYSARSCQEVVRQVKHAAGIQKAFTPHKFRHGYAMNLLENGTDIERIKDLLGHSNSKTTRIYARMNNTVIQATESPLEQIMRHHPTEKLLIHNN